MSHARRKAKSLTTDIAREALDLHQDYQQDLLGGLSPDRVLGEVAKYFGFGVEALKRGGKQPDKVKARHAAFAVLNALCPTLSDSGIARVVGVHHTTVLSAKKGLEKNFAPGEIGRIVGIVGSRVGSKSGV